MDTIEQFQIVKKNKNDLLNLTSNPIRYITLQ